jgi:hypothetical protein
MPDNLRQLIQNKNEGKPYDLKKYITFIDRLCLTVYSKRFPNQNKTPLVDFEGYRNECWGHIETPKFQNSFIDCATNLKKNADIERYLYKTLDNLLQKKILERTPGLETRKKQMDRVLMNHCLKVCRVWCSCWKLLSLKGISITRLADLNLLLDASTGLKVPKVKYPCQGAKKGPAISDDEMRKYLLEVLENSGGMTQRNTMISFIMQKFGITPVHEQHFLDHKEDDEEEPATELSLSHLSRLVYEREGHLVSPDHLLMAQEVVSKLKNMQIKVFYKIYVQEYKQSDIAQSMEISDSQVSNIKKEIQTFFQGYFNQKNTQISFEEGEAVFQLIKLIIEQEMIKS